MTLYVKNDIFLIITNRKPAMKTIQPDQDLEILTAEQLADLFDVSDRTIYRKVEKKEIPFFRIGKKGGIRFLKSTILEWIQAQQK